MTSNDLSCKMCLQCEESRSWVMENTDGDGNPFVSYWLSYEGNLIPLGDALLVGGGKIEENFLEVLGFSFEDDGFLSLVRKCRSIKGMAEVAEDKETYSVDESIAFLKNLIDLDWSMISHNHLSHETIRLFYRNSSDKMGVYNGCENLIDIFVPIKDGVANQVEGLQEEMEADSSRVEITTEEINSILDPFFSFYLSSGTVMLPLGGTFVASGKKPADYFAEVIRLGCEDNSLVETTHLLRSFDGLGHVATDKNKYTIEEVKDFLLLAIQEGWSVVIHDNNHINHDKWSLIFNQVSGQLGVYRGHEKTLRFFGIE